MKKLLSGNEAIAMGAYHAGLRVAAAYPGTPSTEIMENLSRYKDIHAEWSPNEKVSLEVGLGACYTGARTLVSMKHVGLNVAADPFMAATITGVIGGLVLVSADDPGMHSSQNEQDNRYFAKFAKIPLLEPSDSQEAYDMMSVAFEISEQFDTPVMLRSTTRISHSKTVVDINKERSTSFPKAVFKRDLEKFVALPVNARKRQLVMLQRLEKLSKYSEISPLNYRVVGGSEIGVITSGISYNYAREVFPNASFLKLGLSFPLPEATIRDFAKSVKKLVVVEELEPFMEEQILAMGITVEGKRFIPRAGELNVDTLSQASYKAGWTSGTSYLQDSVLSQELAALPKRPPILCPGCPHIGVFSILGGVASRRKKDSVGKELFITGDIGCYTLAAYPVLSAMDTCACMGAGISQALGMEKAGLDASVVAVIGDSTFLHSGVTGLMNVVYNKSTMTVIILDNRTTAMTGHQHHPGTGYTAQGEETYAVDITALVKSLGVTNVAEVNAFDLRALRSAIKSAIAKPELVVLVVKGDCAAITKKKVSPMTVDPELCTGCSACLSLGCAAMQKEGEKVSIDPQLCVGCTLCQQLCVYSAVNMLSRQESTNG